MDAFAMGTFMGTFMSSIINSYHSPPSGSYLCQGTEHDKDGIKSKVSRCIACGKDYCDTCWDRIDPHKDQSSRTTHERNDPILVDMLNDVLSVKERTVEQKQIIHQEDAKNLWFGVTESDGKQYVYEGPSYGNLILDNVALQPWGIYPGLVTFVGETGRSRAFRTARIYFDAHRGWEKRFDQTLDRFRTVGRIPISSFPQYQHLEVLD